MRINHNLAALNSFRNLTSANTQNSKSMEKLSSGLRINRAADDAAGLAISETMRSQIRGLNQASRNSQDAISLLQTAEGGLTETHSILHRMRELGVQAANATYTANDRMEIQKEVDQLKDEVDRIANTTSFNNKNLLDGSASAITSSDKISTKVIMRGGLRVVDQFGMKTAGGGSYQLDIAATAGDAQIQKSNIFKNNHAGDTVQGLSIDGDSGIEHVAAADVAKGSYQIVTDANIVSAAVTGTASIGQYYAASNSSASGKLLSGISATGTLPYNASILMEVQSAQYDADGITATNIVFSISWYQFDKSGNFLNTSGTFDVTGTIALATTTITMAQAELQGGLTGFSLNSLGSTSKVNVVFDVAFTGLSVGDKSVVNLAASTDANTITEKVTVKYSTASSVASGDTYTNTVVDWKFTNDTLNNKVTDFHYFTIDASGNAANGSTEITFGGLGDSDTADGTDHTTFRYQEGLGQVASLDTQLKEIDKFWNASGKFLLDDPQTLTLVQGNGSKTTITLFNTDTIKDVRDKLNNAIVEGLGQGDIVSGNEQDNFVSYVTDADSDSVETTEGSFVIRSAQAGQDGVINIIGNEQLINALGFNTVQEASESKFSVTVTDAHDATNVIAEDVEISGNTLIGVVHENVDVKFDANADINVVWNGTAKEFDLSGDTSSTYSTFVHLVDNSQVFQIGANEMQDMGAAIGRMDALALGVNNILVTDRDSASKAISTIDNAISRVSAQRSSIGAVQNRLEHTINNLGVAGENLTSAESRIRDVDMADEMMQFSKTNVLSQAATAMLAQANQKPQQVMQLLQG